MDGENTIAPESTTTREYTERLRGRKTKRPLVYQLSQIPYKWHIRSLRLGGALDVGCGVGRYLEFLRGHGYGVDHNVHSIEAVRRKGFAADTPDEFLSGPRAVPGSFDSLLCSHVLEHMTAAEAEAMLRDYVRFIRPGGRVLLVTPQEAGFASDATHVEFRDTDDLRRIAAAVGIEAVRTYSFPFPRPVGRVFKHNEFVFVGRVLPEQGEVPAAQGDAGTA